MEKMRAVVYTLMLIIGILLVNSIVQLIEVQIQIRDGNQEAMEVNRELKQETTEFFTWYRYEMEATE